MKLNLLLPFILLFIVKIQPQQKNFDFEFDYAQFGFDSTANFIEFYYSFNQASLTYQEADSISFVEGALTLTLASFYIPLSDSAMIAISYRGVTFWLPLLFGMMAIRRLDKLERKTNPKEYNKLHG